MRPVKSLLIGTAILCTSGLVETTTFARPQTGGPPIRVESDEVVVPTGVYSWQVVAPSIQGLTARDFRLFEDGKEQIIQRVVAETFYEREFVDNFGVKEWEWAWTPGQKWAMVLREPLPISWGITGSDNFLYLVGYTPPPSTEGSCHQIRVKVDRKDAVAVARDEYCNTPHSAFDPLAGTTFKKSMEDFAALGSSGKIPLALQAGVFYKDGKTGRLYITVEFPSMAIKFRDNPEGLRGEVGVLTTAYKRDGMLAAHFSDIYEDSGPIIGDGGVSSSFHVFIPNHHEGQMELPPGDYELRIVLGDGSKFGRAEVPLTVDSYDGKRLGISSIFVCAQFHDHKQTMLNTADGRPSTLSDFIPLVSKGMEFTPAADTSFTKDYLHGAGLLFAYYEIYEPLLTSAPETTVRTRMRIINTTTGALETDTGLRSAADWMEAGKSVIPVSQEVAMKKLTKGSYRIEVQASDSTGRSTPWRTATFTVE